MKQYRITTQNIATDDSNDAYIAPEDPVWELKATQLMGGLGAYERLAEYKSKLVQPVVSSNKGQIQQEQGIKPGTEEWFRHWFGKDNK